MALCFPRIPPEQPYERAFWHLARATPARRAISGHDTPAAHLAHWHPPLSAQTGFAKRLAVPSPVMSSQRLKEIAAEMEKLAEQSQRLIQQHQEMVDKYNKLLVEYEALLREKNGEPN